MGCNVCLWCRVAFPVGGRGRPRRTQPYCSKRCSNRARGKHGVAQTMEPTDAAYLAGIVDGEGSIVRIKKQNGRDVWRLVVVNTDLDLLNWCRETTGCGAVTVKALAGERNKASWTWQCYADNTCRVLEQLRPYLKIKAWRADDALAELRRTAMRLSGNLTVAIGG